jgi:hypothetical protein
MKGVFAYSLITTINNWNKPLVSHQFNPDRYLDL